MYIFPPSLSAPEIFLSPIPQAFDNAGREFERDYLPDLQRRVAEAKARQETAKQVRCVA